MESRPGKKLKRPRGQTTSYAYFVKYIREEHNGQPCHFVDLTRECSEKWKILSKEERKVFDELGNEDSKRYKLEMRKLIAEGGFGYRRRKRASEKQGPTPPIPVKPITDFSWFSLDEGSKLKGQPILRGERKIVGRTLGLMWAEADSVTKQKYHALAQRDKERYVKETAASVPGRHVVYGGFNIGNPVYYCPSHRLPNVT